jgi:signal transduction histidine kinase
LERKGSSSEKQSLHEPPNGQGRNLAIPRSPLGLLFSIALSIFVYEAILMLLFSFFPSLSGWLKTLLDPTLLVVLLSPTLYFFLFRPMTRHLRERRRAEERLENAHEELELRVSERTAELAEKNEELKREFQKRWQAEDKLNWEFRVNAALSELYAPLISPSSSIETIAKVILDRAKALTGSEHGYVNSIDLITGDAVGHTLTEMMEDQCSVSEERKKVIFPRGGDGLYHGLWGHALNTAEGFFTNSPATHEASKSIPEGHVPIQRFLSVPVLLGEEIVGQIALANKGEDYTERDLESIQRVAGFYALAIQRNRAREDLQKAKAELEIRVEARTMELAKANARLRAEVSERIRIQEQIEQSKTMLRGIFDGISEPLILMDVQLQVKMVNRAAADYYGIAKPEGLLAGTCHQLLKESPTPCEGCEVPGAISGGKSRIFERKGFINPERLEQIFVYPLKGEDGQGRDALLRISDVTEQRLFEKQLIQSEKLASLGTLVSSIAHEINNPNSFITLNIPILRDYVEALIPIVDAYAERHPDFELFQMSYPEFRKDVMTLLDNIQHGSDRINRVVYTLREFSQVEGKKEERWVDVKSVVKRSLSLCGVKIRRAVKSFITEIPEDLPKIYTDPYSLEQIIMNLLVNAADASDKKDSWVKLSVAVKDTWLDHAIIEVRDNGHGMDEEVRQKIFDPFFTSKAQSGGTGLGLYVCHNLAEAMRGRIEVKSEPGKGSTFRVILPDKERRRKRRV